MIDKGRETAFGQFGQSSVSVRSAFGPGRLENEVAGRQEHGARDGRAAERGEGGIHTTVP